MPSQYNCCILCLAADPPVTSLGGKHSLLRVWLPPPQVTEQGLQELQGPKDGHGRTLHLLTSIKVCLQGLFVPLERRPHSRVLRWVPPPQVVLHSVHFVHGPNSIEKKNPKIVIFYTIFLCVKKSCFMVCFFHDDWNLWKKKNHQHFQLYESTYINLEHNFHQMRWNSNLDNDMTPIFP